MGPSVYFTVNREVGVSTSTPRLPPSPRLLAVAVTGFVLVHAAAVGVVWVNGQGPAPPDPVRVGPDADPARLLAAAGANGRALPRETTVTLRYRENGTVRYRATVHDDPNRARFSRTQTAGEGTLASPDIYVTGYGRWVDGGKGWYWTGVPDATAYGDLLRGLVLFDPRDPPAGTYAAEEYRNGTVVVRSDAVLPPWDLGLDEPREVRYHVEFVDDVPLVTRVVARGETSEWVVTQRRGATVERPEALPPFTPREAFARLLNGVLSA